ncbi:response regulator [Roseomonas nepalensis]|uniref:histidine kinase n=1 Tax=Muricoccus nepalensis TaxID=1854500 RepID=A0A502FXK5_9PROT|nr:PAS-domain containing protein [Roseomonas nepalensis]TPG53796.1 response regulator [Roseomonas nepalensis]
MSGFDGHAPAVPRALPWPAARPGPAPARRFRLPAAGRGILLGAVALLVLEGLTTWQIVHRGRATADANARAEVAALADGAAAAVNRSFLAADSALAGLSGLLAAALPGVEAEGPSARRSVALSRVLTGLVDSSVGLRDLVLLPADGGAPVAAALPGSRRRPPPLPHAALRQAASQLGTPGGGATVAGPVRNPATGEWALFRPRAILLPGLPPLLAVAEVPIFVVAASLGNRGAAGEAPGQRAMLIRTDDGVLLASAPHDEARIGQPVPEAQAGEEGPGRYVGRRRTLYPAMQVVVVQDAAAALAAWEESEGRILMAGGGLAALTIGIAALLLVMLAQRDRAEAERARGRQLLEGSIEAMSDGFVMWDEEDRLIVCNQRYRDFYRESTPAIRPGATLADILRYGVRHGQYPQAGPDHERFVAEALAHARHAWSSPPLERLLPDGRWILVTERRVPGGGSVGIRTDITQQKRAAADLAAARDAAAAAGAAKSLFLARMSHELRTPLNGVLGMAQALAGDPGLSPLQRERALLLEAAGRHLLGVANDVLDLSHVEAGRMPLRRAPAALAPLLEGCAALIRPAALRAGIALLTEHDPALPPGAMLDAMRVRQLVLNLLSNAVKFTPDGGRVVLRSRVAGRGARLRIEVLDTGPGIPPERRADVFRDFVRLEGAGDTPRAEGFGLGLAIAAGIVEAMGGRIGVEDDAEAIARGETGSLFWVELPLDAAEAPDALPAAGTPPAARPLRVLVVDDVPTNRLVAQALLERAGHRTELAPGGAEGLEAVRGAARCGDPFDLVLMDLSMPGLDGLEAARRLRARPAGEGGAVPVVALTAGVVDADGQACRAAGMNGYLSKPLTREALLAEIERVVPLGRREATVDDHEAASSGLPVPVSG